jgi:hypothetical protein
MTIEERKVLEKILFFFVMFFDNNFLRKLIDGWMDTVVQLDDTMKIILTGVRAA